MKQKPVIQSVSLKERILPLARKGLRILPAAGVFSVLTAQSAQAEITDRLSALGTDVQAWANIVVPTIIVFAFIAVIYFVVTSDPKWKGSLAVFIVALIIWGGLDEMIAWSHKIGGGDGTINIVSGGDE